MKSSLAVLGLVVLGLLSAASSSPLRVSDPRPDVLLILTDDQTLESMRVMERTRRLIGDEGTTFANATVSTSLCCPSRATLLTGQYAHNHGVRDNKPPLGGYLRLEPHSTLPVWLRQAGYSTAHVGKYLNGYGHGTPAVVPPGWTRWFGLVDPTTYRVYDYRVSDQGKVVSYGEDEDDYQTDVLAAKAEEILRAFASADRPFFLSVAPVPPHLERSDESGKGVAPRPAPRHEGSFADEPLPAKASYDEADVSDKPPFVRKLPRLGEKARDRTLQIYRARLASLLAVDDLVDRLVRALAETGRLDRTVILFTSDNGFFSGEHRLLDGKYYPYEESIRVPLLIRGGGFPKGRVAQQVVSNVDLAATIVALAKAQPGRVLDGRSLLPLALEAQTARNRGVLIEGFGPEKQRPSFAAIRTPRWLWAEYGDGSRELYDLSTDPLELTSRHRDPTLADLRASLAARLAKLRRCAGAGCAGE
jgi:arylsulfatase A-like enzyme